MVETKPVGVVTIPAARREMIQAAKWYDERSQGLGNQLLDEIGRSLRTGLDFPLAGLPTDPGWKFGSAHPGIVQFVFCDGGVRGLEKSIDPAVLGLLTQRNDGQTIPYGGW